MSDADEGSSLGGRVTASHQQAPRPSRRTRAVFTPTEHWTTQLDDQLRVVALELADDLSELSRVRAWANQLLQDLTGEQRMDMLVVVDKLTSNALRHGEPPRQARLLRKRGWLSVEVDDTCVDPACPRPPSVSGGHGLKMVAAMSVSWGQEQRSTGKTVWAAIDLSPDQARNHSAASPCAVTNDPARRAVS
ncbi:ATP-binding protein [Amycolatopsis sp. NPDC051061]|uniref:ATP-binding protein n=1 Tax=Amycolatopsis sp. NPDC051061 TaxID=3155042 RepID=UPI00341BE1F6